MTPEERTRQSYAQALSLARGRLAIAVIELERAPVYLARPIAGAWERIDPRLQQAIDRLAQTRREAQRHRAAIRALEADLDELTRFADLPAERTRLELAVRTWINGVRDAAELLAQLSPDPRRAYVGKTPAMAVDTARAIVALRDTQGGDIGPIATLPIAVPLADEDTWDLERTGRFRLDAIPRGQSVGVLMPLRIETRFAPPDSEHAEWRLRLRLFPEAASLNRHAGPPTDAERAHTEAMWRECDGLLDSPTGTLAFQRLVERCGGARACWLARTLPVARLSPTAPIEVTPVVARPEEHREFQQPAGLPPTLEVWLARGGLAPTLMTTLAVDRAKLASQVDLRAVAAESAAVLAGDLPETWWLSFEEAKRIGLGADIPVGTTTPSDIDTLYVIGLGEQSPRALFEAHVAAGQLAVMAPGTATNTVAGEPTTDLGRGSAYWWELARRSGLDQPAPLELELALAGGRAQLAPLHDGALELRGPAEAMVRALWPAVWGRGMKDVWGAGVDAYDAGEWAARHLTPEGPFPAIRVGDQPYGVLPVTTLGKWVTHPSDPRVEAPIRSWSWLFRERAADAAETEGNVVGATTERLVELLARTPVTPEFGWRWVLTLPWLRMAWLVAGTPLPMSTLETMWDDRARGVLDQGLAPRARHQPQGPVHRLQGSLLGEPHAGLKPLLRAHPEQLVSTPDREWREPLSLLARLVRHSLILTNAELQRAATALGAGTLATLDPALDIPVDDATWLVTHAAASVSETTRDQLVGSGAATGRDVVRGWRSVRDGAQALLSVDSARLDALVRATLDCASHRIDAWVTGIAARRMRWLAARATAWRIGAYGWVDAPRPFAARLPGTAVLPPGPTEAGLLHAPTPTQAMTAAVLRDRALRDPGDSRWDLALDSTQVRLAAELGEQVRSGIHLKEALGREIERRAGDPATVQVLRKAFPMRPEHQGRRVCDGEAVLQAARETPATLPGTLAQDVAPLQDVIDTYGDLLVADAVYQLVSGRGDLAQAAMEAAAGLGAPPDLRVLRTARSGRAVSTAVFLVLPAASMPAAPGANPARIVDPAFAQLVDARLGAASEWSWTVAAPGGATPAVSLAALGLEPLNVLLLASSALVGLVRAASGATTGLVAAAPATQRRSAALGRLARLCAGGDELPGFLDPPDEMGRRVFTSAATAELGQRLARLRAEATGLRDRLRNSTVQAAALAEAPRWSLAVDATLPEAERAQACAATLDARLRAPTTPADLAGLRSALRALSGAAALPVLLSTTAGLLDTESAPLAAVPQVSGRPALDTAWLETIAAVRPALARLEALQLGADAEAGLAPWSAWATASAVGDPWLQNAESGHRLLVAYTPPGMPLTGSRAAPLALAILDQWSETIPSRSHTTEAAFGFNAPKARAPQSVLVAVPPDVTTPLDTATLVDILAETRRLARARMATAESLMTYDVALSLPLLLATGRAAVDLEG